MYIGIFTGSFDPIHDGHIQIVKYAIEKYRDLNEVWLVPELRNPYNEGKESSYDDRMYMCKLATRNLSNIYVSDAEKELSLKLNKNTVFTSDVLDNLPKNNSYKLIVSSADINRFYMWNKHKHILDDYGLIVVEVPGYPIDMNNKKVAMVINHPNVKLITEFTYKNDIMEETEIRESIRLGNRVTDIDENIFNYIAKENLYI